MPRIYKIKKSPRRKTDRSRERHAIYDTRRWRNLVRIKLMDSPLCELCQKKGVIRPAENIHHIVSFMSTDDPIERSRLAYDYSNLMSLCVECHSEIHKNEKKCEEGYG